MSDLYYVVLDTWNPQNAGNPEVELVPEILGDFKSPEGKVFDKIGDSAFSSLEQARRVKKFYLDRSGITEEQNAFGEAPCVYITKWVE